MESNKKEMYNSPEVDIFEVKTEGVICASGEVNATMNGEFEEIDL